MTIIDSQVHASRDYRHFASEQPKRKQPAEELDRAD